MRLLPGSCWRLVACGPFYPKAPMSSDPSHMNLKTQSLEIKQGDFLPLPASRPLCSTHLAVLRPLVQKTSSQGTWASGVSWLGFRFQVPGQKKFSWQGTWTGRGLLESSEAHLVGSILQRKTVEEARGSGTRLYWEKVITTSQELQKRHQALKVLNW